MRSSAAMSSSGASNLILFEFQVELARRAEPTPKWLEYVTSQKIDLVVYAFIGILAVTQAKFLPGRRFVFCERGVSTAVCHVLGADAATTIDLVAWPTHYPNKFATAIGVAPGLGIDQVKNSATYFGGHPLLLYRSPLNWIRAGCRGAVILNPQRASEWIDTRLGCLAGEDLRHSRELADMLCPHVSRDRILAPMLRGGER